MRKVLLTVLLVVLVSGIAVAAVKPDPPNWDNLKQLVPGDQVQVVLNDAKSYRGQFESRSDEGMIVRLAAGEQTFARKDVLRVSTKGQPHRVRNALIGLGTGVGAGVAIAAGTSRNDPEAQSIGYAFIPPFAGGAGAAVGALMPTGGWHDVYRAR
jgi:hypothetical protein